MHAFPQYPLGTVTCNSSAPDRASCDTIRSVLSQDSLSQEMVFSKEKGIFVEVSVEPFSSPLPALIARFENLHCRKLHLHLPAQVQPAIRVLSVHLQPASPALPYG